MRYIAFGSAVLFGGLFLALSAVSTNGSEPTISVSPTEGSTGDQVTISGDGFEPNDTIYISIHPPQASGGYGIGVVLADSEGSFVAVTRVGNVYDSEPFPESAPPGEWYEVQMSPGDWEILAYPASFGDRTAETIARTPKVNFEVTASSLPNTGGERPIGGEGLSLELIAGLLLMVAGASVMLKAANLKRKTR